MSEQLSDRLGRMANLGHTVSFDEAKLALELEAELTALRTQCEWLRAHWVWEACPPPPHRDKCYEITCDDCAIAYLKTEPWRQEAHDA